eukprot:1148196-Pelagomonas_calceolata.AAC.7
MKHLLTHTLAAHTASAAAMALEMERKAAPLVDMSVLKARRIDLSSSSAVPVVTEGGPPALPGAVLPSVGAECEGAAAVPPEAAAAVGPEGAAAVPVPGLLVVLSTSVGGRRERRVSSLTRSARSMEGSACK